MTIASTWLLLHAASQWARTRSEAKLLHRIPHAAKHALALQKHAHSSAPGQGAGQGGYGSGGHQGGSGSDPLGAAGVGVGGVAGKGVSSDGGHVGSAGGSRGVSSTGEPSAPVDAAADVPAKAVPPPLESV